MKNRPFANLNDRVEPKLNTDFVSSAIIEEMDEQESYEQARIAAEEDAAWAEHLGLTGPKYFEENWNGYN